MITKSNRFAQSQLTVESLESRMMLSTVSLNIAGQTGQEDFRVFVNDEVVLDAGAQIGGSDFSIEVADSVRAEDIRIEFTNDFYDPAENFDRNLIVNFFALNETRFDFNDSGMFSSGTWRSDDGVTPGFGRGNVLHANGFFQYRGEAGDPQVEFGERAWTVSRPFSSEVVVDGDELVLSGLNGPVSVYTEVDFEPGTLSRFTVEGWRERLTGQFDQINRPWSTAGINFYDSSGNLIDEIQIELNGDATDPDTVRSRTLTTHADATSAFVWAWVDGTSQFANIPLRLRGIQLEAIDISQDSTPPTIQQSGTASLFTPNSEATFAVEVNDEFRLGQDNAGLAPGAILVTGPNGFSQIAEPRTGFGDFVNSGTIIYGIVKADGSEFRSADNGIYEIFLQEGRLTDAAGNVTPAQRIGSLELAITDPIPDNEVPTINVSFSDIPAIRGTIDAVQITARITDNVSPFPFPGRLTVFRADGFSQELRGIAGGFDQATGENWELFQFRPGAGGFTSADNGEYFIRLEANQLIDQRGNAAPEQVLGSFTIEIPDDSLLT